MDKRITLAAAAVVMGFAARPVTAATYQWTEGTGNPYWNTTIYDGGGLYQSNWVNLSQFQLQPVEPVSSSTTVILYNTPAYDSYGNPTTESSLQNIGNPFLLNSLQFESGAGVYNVGGNPLEFSGTSPTIIEDAYNTSPEILSANVILDATLGVDIGTQTPLANNQGMLISGNISDNNGNNAGLTLGGGMQLYLQGSNSYTGQTTVPSDTILFLLNSDAVLNSTVNVANGGVVDVSGLGFALGGLSGNGVLSFSAGSVDPNTLVQLGAVIGTNNQNTTFSGVFSISSDDPANNIQYESGVTKYGTGTFTYSGNSSAGSYFLNYFSVQQGAVDFTGGSLLVQAAPTLTTYASLYVEDGTSLNVSNGFHLTVNGFTNVIGSGAMKINGATCTVAYAPNTTLGGTDLNDTATLAITNGTFTTNTLDTNGTAAMSISDPAGGMALTINGKYDSSNASVTTSTMNAPISDSTGGPGSVHITNGALVYINPTNTYSGQTLVDSSSRLYLSAYSAQNSTLNLQSSGSAYLQTASSTPTLGGLAGDSTGVLNFAPQNGVTIMELLFGQNNQSTTYSGGFALISPPSGFIAGLSKQGSGVFTFGGNAGSTLNYLDMVSGGVNLTGGSMALSCTAYDSLYVNTGANLTVENGFHLTTTGFNPIFGNGSITLNGSGVTWTQQNATGLTNGGIWVGNSGQTSQLQVINAAQLNSTELLIGNPSYTPSPGVGYVGVSSNASLSVTATGAVSNTTGQIVINNGSELYVYDATVTTPTINTQSGSTVALTDPTGGGYALTLNGFYSSSNTYTESVIAGNVASAGTAGSIHITNGAGVIMEGAGTYTGQTLVDNSSFLGIDSQYAVQNSTVTLKTAAKVYVNPAAVTFGELAGDYTGQVIFQPNSGVTNTVLTVGQSGQSGTFAGTFSQFNQPSGFVAGLVKTGVGTFTYTGNSGTGLTSVSNIGGTLDLNGASLSLTSTSSGTAASIYVDAGATLDIDGGSKIKLSDIATLHNTAVLNIAGSGTTFTQTDLANGNGGLFDGQTGGTSSVNVSNNAVANLTYVLIGYGANPTSPGIGRFSITSGAAVTVAYDGGDNGQTIVDTGYLTVSDATLVTGAFWIDPGSSASLSDPAGGVALTINRPYNPANGDTESYVYGPITDASAGKGSVNITSGALVRMSAANTYTGPTTLQGSSTLVNTGSLLSPLTAQTASTASGTGSYGSVTLMSSAVISPGDISNKSTGEVTVQSLTLDDGSAYLWKINTLATNGGTAGNAKGWDLLSLGALTLPTTGGHTTIQIDSVANGTAGALSGFDPSQSYTWLLAESNTSVFSNLAAFTLDSSEFDANNTDTGGFSLLSADGGDELFLAYGVVPEPGNLALACLAILLPLRRPRRGRR